MTPRMVLFLRNFGWGSLRMMEVEQKFIITSETRCRLSALGAHRATTRNVLDVYYDTPQNLLMRDDHWLRKRNGNWELKYRLTPSAVVTEGRGEVGREGARLSEQRDYRSRDNETELERAKSTKPSQLPSSLSPPQTQQTDQYIEEEDTVNILAHLEKVFQLLTRSVITDAVQSSPMATVTMDTLLEFGALVPIVEIEFVRECWKVGDRGGCEGDSGGRWEEVKVDLDKCTYGGGGGEGREYGVGEVEIMVASSDEAEGAAQRCRDLAQQLGECPAISPGGKVSYCLQLTHPQLWQTLMNAGLLRRKNPYSFEYYMTLIMD